MMHLKCPLFAAKTNVRFESESIGTFINFNDIILLNIRVFLNAQ